MRSEFTYACGLGLVFLVVTCSGDDQQMDQEMSQQSSQQEMNEMPAGDEGFQELSDELPESQSGGEYDQMMGQMPPDASQIADVGQVASQSQYQTDMPQNAYQQYSPSNIASSESLPPSNTAGEAYVDPTVEVPGKLYPIPPNAPILNFPVAEIPGGAANIIGTPPILYFPVAPIPSYAGYSATMNGTGTVSTYTYANTNAASYADKAFPTTGTPVLNYPVASVGTTASANASSSYAPYKSYPYTYDINDTPAVAGVFNFPVAEVPTAQALKIAGVPTASQPTNCTGSFLHQLEDAIANCNVNARQQVLNQCPALTTLANFGWEKCK